MLLSHADSLRSDFHGGVLHDKVANFGCVKTLTYTLLIVS